MVYDALTAGMRMMAAPILFSAGAGRAYMDIVDFGRYAGGLLVTLGLLALLAFGARRFNLLSFAQGGTSGRLKLVDSLMLDPRRRVAIVRVDDREHVVLTSATGEILLESREARPELDTPEKGAA